MSPMRVFFSVLVALFFLPWAFPVLAGEELRPDEHYDVIEPPVAVTGGKPQVVEVFNFTCPHCYRFSPIFIKWAKEKHDRFEIVVLPLLWKNQKDTSVRAYYAAAHLGKADEMKEAIFTAHFKDKKSIDEPDVMVEVAQSVGLDAKVFRETMDSFGIAAKLAQSRRLWLGYGVDSTPTLVVNGRYRINPAQANNNFENLLANAEKLASR